MANMTSDQAWNALDSLDWSAGDATRKSTEILYKMIRYYGWNLADVGAKYGFTADQMRDHFAKYGLTFSSTVSNGSAPYSSGYLPGGSMSFEALTEDPAKLAMIGGGILLAIYLFRKGR